MDAIRNKIVQQSAQVSKKASKRSKAATLAKATAGPSELTAAVAKALLDVQAGNAELAAELRPLQIAAAREVELSGGRRAIVVSVPVPQLKAWRRVQLRVVRELEKKFGERQVMIVGARRIQGKPKHGKALKQARPRSRTLTAVHEAWLEDMLYPTEIVGKRTRVKTDGRRVIKVFLDPKDQAALESKVDSFSAVYRKLTGKDVVFDFPLAA